MSENNESDMTVEQTYHNMNRYIYMLLLLFDTWVQHLS